MYRVVPESPKMSALIYSEPGAGKTTLSSTAQDHEALTPVLFANIEGGMLSIAHRRDIHAVDILSTEELRQLYYDLKHGEGPYGDVRTLVIDNVTELQTRNLDEIVQLEVKAGRQTDEDDIWQENYGTSTVQLLRLFRWFKDLEINLILTAHAKFVYPPTGKSRNAAAQLTAEPLAVLPMLTQKLCKSLMGMVNFVWFLQYDAEADERRMLTRPDGIIQAKTRGPKFAKALGSVVVNPTLPALYDMLVKAESGKPDRDTKRRKK